MTEVVTNETPHLSNDHINVVLQQMADRFGQSQRSPVLHSPSEQDLDYENVTFASLDGVPLEGWFIPSAGSNKLIIANHPMVQSVRDAYAVRAVALAVGVQREWLRGQLHPGLQYPP